MYFGGAICNNGTMTVKGCTFYNNSAENGDMDSGYGGAIYNDGGDLYLTGSLFFKNIAYSYGDISTPVVGINYSANVESSGYNVVDWPSGTVLEQPGFACHKVHYAAFIHQVVFY